MQAAISMLKQDYNEKIKLEEALKLSMKVLSKTLDVKLSAEKSIFRDHFIYLLLAIQ